MSLIRVLLSASAAGLFFTAAASAAPAGPLQYEVQEGLNDNAFLQQGKVAAHLLLRSGNSPRILVAFPAGNSGVGLWFADTPQKIVWRLVQQPRPMSERDAKGRTLYGITAEAMVAAPSLTFRKAVLSSVRVLRDFQALGTAPRAIETSPTIVGNRVRWARDRLDGAPGYVLGLQLLDGRLEGDRLLAGSDGRITLRIVALCGETPLTPFSEPGLLNRRAAADVMARKALRFLSYREKFEAGSWRFNTYFGRDTLMSVRLLMPALTPQAVETGLDAVLSRLSPTGEVAHEEDIGEFAVLDHMKSDGSRSAAPVYDYKMIDGNYLLAPVTSAWLLDDPRSKPLALSFLAGLDSRQGQARTRRGEDLVANLKLVLRSAEPFAGDPRAAHLIALKPGVPVGEWRDSNTGLGGGRYPYDVNAILVPAALHSAARLYSAGLLDPYLSADDRGLFERAAAMAKIWSDRAPGLFQVEIDRPAAARDIAGYAAALSVPSSPALASLEPGGTRFFAVSLDSSGRPIPIMNSDFGFELLFGRPRDTKSMAKQVNGLLRPFPAGLMTDVGMLVANGAYASAALQPAFSRNAYHGAVVWSWQQALFAAGLQRQLERSDLTSTARKELTAAQSLLWKGIGATSKMSNSELWSWSFTNGAYRVAPFGASGSDADESNAAQLWSTVYLAVRPPVHGK